MLSFYCCVIRYFDIKFISELFIRNLHEENCVIICKVLTKESNIQLCSRILFLDTILLTVLKVKKIFEKKSEWVKTIKKMPQRYAYVTRKETFCASHQLFRWDKLYFVYDELIVLNCLHFYDHNYLRAACLYSKKYQCDRFKYCFLV